MKLTKFGQVTLIAVAALLLAPTTTLAVTLFSAAGSDATSIQDEVDAFRAALGNNNGSVPGPLDAGRREINWDGGGPSAASVDTPPDLFNRIVPRGVIYDTPGSGFLTSGSNGDPLSTEVFEEFGDINPTYSNTFGTFSAEKLFTAVGSNILDVNFFVPGTLTPAVTNGFGAVFTDVDLANTTQIEYFDSNGSLLESEFVTAVPGSNESLSFLGVLFDAPVVSRVRITNGNTALGPNDDPANGVDIVVVDDFIYGEPQVVPEPSSMLGLLLGGFLPLASWIRKRRSSSAA